MATLFVLFNESAGRPVRLPSGRLQAFSSRAVARDFLRAIREAADEAGTGVHYSIHETDEGREITAKG